MGVLPLMALDIGDGSWAWVLSHAGVWALVLARVLGLCLTAPALAVPELDWRFRLGLAALLGMVLIPVLEPVIVPPVGWPGIARRLFLEVLTGGVLGWSAALIIAGARLAGELVAAQAGLSTATLLDPETGEEHDVIGPALRLDRAGGVSGARRPIWSWSGRWWRATRPCRPAGS